MISSREVALLLFAVCAGEALAFLLALWTVWKSFDARLREQAQKFGERMDALRDKNRAEMDELRTKNRELQAQVDKMTNILIANYGIRIEAGEDVVVGQDVVGRDKTTRTGQ